jgi:hypothetical protein
VREGGESHSRCDRWRVTGCRNLVDGWMGGVDGVCGRVWRNDGWMRVDEEENKHFLFSQLSNRSKRATIPCHGCLGRYQSGGSGSRRLMRRKTRGHDVVSSWHSNRPPIMTHDVTRVASDLQPTIYSSQSGCD